MAAPIRQHVLEKVLWKTKKLMVKQRCLTSYRMLSQRKLISELLKDEKNVGQRLEIKGWVNGIRRHKDVVFINIKDGSSTRHLQVVTTPDKSDGITFGSSISAEGELLKSPSSGQLVEFKANKVAPLGHCDPKVYPFKVKERHLADYTRGFLHLRHRTDLFGALLRVRNAATMAIHQYFQNNGYCLVNTPIITSSDAEGAGEVFSVQPANSDGSQLTTENQSNPEDEQQLFFGHPAFLTVSGQLHLEAVTGGFSKAYTFGPTFRAENAKGRYHLCEFYMIEGEIAFTESLEDILQEMENLVKVSYCQVMENAAEDVEIFHRFLSPGHKKVVEKIVSSDFIRLSYADAVKILSKKNGDFEFKVSWGCYLQKEHEQYLVSYFKDVPVFVTDFPKELKPFYAKANNDDQTVSAVDLLFPKVGEMFGGSLREDSYDLLKDKLERSGAAHEYEWYLDIRRFGSVPHGGFGMGFERYLQCLLGVPNIKDTIPYPRSEGNCKM